MALPRPNVRYEDTWFYKIKHQFSEIEFISVFRRVVTTAILVEWGGGEEKICLKNPNLSQ